MPTIGKILGRTYDSLTASDGRLVLGEFIAHAFQKVLGFDRYFVHQKSQRELEIRIVKNSKLTRSELEQLEKVLHRFLGTSMEIHFIGVETIELADSGRLSLIISDLDLDFE